MEDGGTDEQGETIKARAGAVNRRAAPSLYVGARTGTVGGGRCRNPLPYRTDWNLRRGTSAATTRDDQPGLVTFAACRPFGPCATSNSTLSPSCRDLKPLPLIAE